MKTIAIILIIAVGILLILLYAKSSYYKGNISSNFNGKVFYNPAHIDKKSFYHFLKWQFTSQKGFWPKKVVNNSFDTPPANILGKELRVSFVGHSTVLLQVDGLNIITDPVWSKRASPFSFVGPKRVIKPGISFADLPKIDLILISHNHYDHLDLPTIKQIATRDNPRIIVPLGNDKIIRSYDKSISVEAYDWGDEVTISDKIKIHIEEALHWSARTIFDRNKALWAAFTIETSLGNIYFAGDTGYGQHFIKAKQKHKEFLLALIPIGAFEPRWFMAHSHINPKEALKAFQELNAKYAMAIHYGTFRLADESYSEPVEQLEKLRSIYNISADNFRIVPVGGFWNIYS